MDRRPPEEPAWPHLRCPLFWESPPWLTDVWAWHGHVPFAMYCVWAMRPRAIVELGTHKGDSYGAFCHAVKRCGLPARCHAVDTWEGDPQAHYYGPEVLAGLRARHDPLFADVSTLHVATFDEARKGFGKGSVDILHIDGLHTYDAVRHDFETWQDTVRPGGVILLHDINVRQEGFGVHVFWEELRRQHPTFEFSHSFGLGVVLVGPVESHPLRWLAELDGPGRLQVRRSFESRGHAVWQEGELARTTTMLRLAAQDASQLRAEVVRLGGELAALRDALHARQQELDAARGHLDAVRGSMVGRTMVRLGKWRF